MKRSLEDFIRENREALDSEEPSPGLWKKVEKELTAPEKKAEVKSPPSANGSSLLQ